MTYTQTAPVLAVEAITGDIPYEPCYWHAAIYTLLCNKTILNQCFLSNAECIRCVTDHIMQTEIAVIAK